MCRENTPVVATLLEVSGLSQSHREDTTFFLWRYWEWGNREQCVTVTNLDDPGLVVSKWALPVV